MKWSVVLLISLGLFAAVSTSVLVGALRAFPSNASAGNLSSKTEVILVANALPAMSIITPNDLTIKNLSEHELPEGYFSDSTQAIGRILAVSVVPDQILTETCFVKDGDRAKLAAAIPYGMRAISVMFPSHSVTGGLLYPGSVVDVLAAFRLPSGDHAKGKAISTTLLQGIQVLAVENMSIVMKDKDEKEYVDNATYSGNRKIMITLMVTSRQAEALQLAREYGSVSVAMRNPLDKASIENNTTVLSEGQLAKFGSIMTPTVLTPERKMALLREITKQAKTSDLSSDDDVLAGFGDEPKQPLGHWNVTVIRGNDIQVQKLDNPKTEDVATEDVALEGI